MHFRAAFTLAAFAFTALWIYALVKPIPRGLGEKVMIALIMLWLWRASWWLLRGRAGTECHNRATPAEGR